MTPSASGYIGNLAALRKQLSADVPPKDADDNLLLATWNVRDPGMVNRRGFGERLPETYFYIAEVLSRFDFVAVQEVNELDEWQKILEIFGPDFDGIATDVTDPSLGGNGERLTYLYDRRKVRFREVPRPNTRSRSGGREMLSGEVSRLGAWRCRSAAATEGEAADRESAAHTAATSDQRPQGDDIERRYARFAPVAT